MKSLPTGLVSAGGVSKSFLARMPAVLRSIGPVKATSFRVARRIANSLRAGHPVENYSDLRDCDLIWIALPEAALDRALREVSGEVALDGKMVVICASARGSQSVVLPGARVATLDAIPSEPRTLIAEGDATVLAEFRRIAAAERRKLIAIEPASKASYLAAVRLASDLLLPYFGAAVETLRSAGFSRPEATRIAIGLAGGALRAYAKGGRKAWSSSTALDLRRSRDRDMAAIRATDPVCARLYEQGIQQALEYFAG